MQALVPLDLIQPVAGTEKVYRFRHAITRDIADRVCIHGKFVAGTMITIDSVSARVIGIGAASA